MRPVRTAFVLLVLLFVNAAAVLFFRFFITVDGPRHVLHAALLKAPWNTPGHLAHGIIYDSDALQGWLGERILMILLLFLTPENAHDLFAALVSCAVVLAVVAFLRAHGTRMGAAILWLAPITFNLLLITGMFHFLLGVAAGFGSVAWWKGHARSSRLRWAGLLIGAVLAWYAHRSGPTVLCMIFLPALVVELIKERTTVATGQRRPMKGRVVFASALVVLSAIQLVLATQGNPLPNPGDLPAFGEAFLLRPLLLLDPAKEQWLLRSIGVLLLIATAAGAWGRWRLGRVLFWHDMFLVLFLILLLVSWFYDAPRVRQLFIAERGRWLALLALVIWLVAIADTHRGWVARTIGGAALCALPVHLMRLIQAEEALSRFQRSHELALEAGAALAPGSLVMPVMVEPEWLLQHLEAYVAIGHDGILLTSKEYFSFVAPTAKWSNARLIRMGHRSSWPARYWRDGIPPEVDHILFIGSGIDRITSKHPWRGLLAERYLPSFDNGYARIYTAAADSTHGTMREVIFHAP